MKLMILIVLENSYILEMTRLPKGGNKIHFNWSVLRYN